MKLYCVASSNKTGKMIAKLIPTKASKFPHGRYYPKLEMHLDYFKSRRMAEKFIYLLER